MDREPIRPRHYLDRRNPPWRCVVEVVRWRSGAAIPSGVDNLHRAGGGRERVGVGPYELRAATPLAVPQAVLEGDCA